MSFQLPPNPTALPALPMYIVPGLEVRQMLLLALCWLRGGPVTDYLNLDLSNEVLSSMVLQAAMDFSRHERTLKEMEAYYKGSSEAFRQSPNL